MASKLYDYLGSTDGHLQNPAVPSQSNMMDQFNEFSKTVSNPKAEVERLLASGKMSKSQFNMLGQMANNMMGQRR